MYLRLCLVSSAVPIEDARRKAGEAEDFDWKARVPHCRSQPSHQNAKARAQRGRLLDSSSCAVLIEVNMILFVRMHTLNHTSGQVYSLALRFPRSLSPADLGKPLEWIYPYSECPILQPLDAQHR